MTSYKTIYEMLLKSTTDVGGFESVQAYPLAKVMDVKKFFQEIPALKLPACLVVVSDDDQTGARVEREATWFWVVVLKDVKGEAYLQVLEIVEALRKAHLNRNIAADVYISHKSRMVIIDSPVEYCVATVSFVTRNYGVQG